MIKPSEEARFPLVPLFKDGRNRDLNAKIAVLYVVAQERFTLASTASEVHHYSDGPIAVDCRTRPVALGPRMAIAILRLRGGKREEPRLLIQSVLLPLSFFLQDVDFQEGEHACKSMDNEHFNSSNKCHVSRVILLADSRKVDLSH